MTASRTNEEIPRGFLRLAIDDRFAKRFDPRGIDGDFSCSGAFCAQSTLIATSTFPRVALE
jgi:hypothetical protein